MATKDRHQHPVLNDTIRLKNFVSSSGTPLEASYVTKIEVLTDRAELRDLEYGSSSFVAETIVNHRRGGVDSEIRSYPDYSDQSEYFWADLVLDPTSYSVGEYLDRWYVVLDETVSLENWTAVSGAALDEHARASLVQTFRLVPSRGKKITVGAIKDAPATTDLTLGSIEDSDGIAAPASVVNVVATSAIVAIRAPQVGDPTMTVGTGLDDLASSGVFDGSFSTTYGVEITATGTPDTFKWTDDGWATETTGVSAAAPVSLGNGVTVEFTASTGHTVGNRWSFEASPAETVGWARLDSNDGVAWSALYFESIAKSPRVQSVAVTYGPPDADGDHPGYSSYDLALTWDVAPVSGGEPLSTAEVWYVYQWDIDDTVEYSPGVPNPWDDAWSRAGATKRMVSEHAFSVDRALAFSSPSPALYQFSFSIGRNKFVLGEKGYVDVQVNPRTADASLERYYRQFVEAATATYKIYSVGSNNELELSKSGTIDSILGQTMHVFLDTTRSPFSDGGLFGVQVILESGNSRAVSEVFPISVEDSTKARLVLSGGLV